LNRPVRSGFHNLGHNNRTQNQQQMKPVNERTNRTRELQSNWKARKPLRQQSSINSPKKAAVDWNQRNWTSLHEGKGTVVSHTQSRCRARAQQSDRSKMKPNPSTQRRREGSPTERRRTGYPNWGLMMVWTWGPEAPPWNWRLHLEGNCLDLRDEVRWRCCFVSQEREERKALSQLILIKTTIKMYKYQH
jgi:hypothetical protein